MIRTLVGATVLLLGAGAALAAGDGAQIFKTHCAKCHGDTGKADTAAGKALKTPALAGDAHVAGMADADVVAKVKTNPKHASTVKGMVDADVEAVSRYVKELAGTK